jgi:hypothetical protein
VPREHIKRGVEMMEGQRRIKLERDRERSATREREFVGVARKDGKVVSIAPEAVEKLKDKRGLRPAGRNGRSAASYFSLAGLEEKWERGPDGMHFFWDGGWEPRPGGDAWPSPQHDPAGNVWVLSPLYEGDETTWVLESEVA